MPRIIAHWNAKPYFEWLQKNERLEARPKVGQTLKIELNGNSEFFNDNPLKSNK